MTSTKVKLNDGREMPVFGLGTYALNFDLSGSATDSLPTLAQQQRGGSKDLQCQLAVEAAISSGYRHIDTAAFYDNEAEVGRGICNKMADGTVKREDVFLTTKLWNDRHEKEKVVPSLKESLKRFGLDYVDLYLIHWPIGQKEDGSYSDTDYLETWRGMEECVELGIARTIGVSNFSIPQLERLLGACKIRPAVNQVEMNPNLTQKGLLKYCRQQGIVLTAYSPFGSMPETKTNPSSPAPRLDDPILTKIGKNYGKTSTQVVLRYLLDCGAAVIPKSVTPDRIAQNIQVFDFRLTDEEIAQIDSFNKDFRVVAVAMWKDHKFFPF